MYAFKFIDCTMARVFAMNRHFSPTSIFGKVIFKNKKFLTEKNVCKDECWLNSGEVEACKLVCCVPLDLTHVPRITCLLCFSLLFHRKRIMVYTFTKTLHPEAAGGVFKNSK